MEYGLQLYSIRNAMNEDMEAALAAVAKVGYTRVEFAGFFGRTAEGVAAILKKYGLTVCGTHTGAHELTADKIDETIAYHKTIGNTRIIIPGYDCSTAEKLDTLVAIINEAQPKLAAAGITLAYHNHSHEFLPLYEGGYLIFDELKNRTNVAFQIDTFWAYAAGKNPLALLAEMKDRVPVIHLKDGDLTKRGYSLGLGTAPVAAVLAAAKEYGMDIVVESEGQEPDGISEVTRCMDFLRSAE